MRAFNLSDWNKLGDATQIAFSRQAAEHIQAQVLMQEYPEIQYKNDIPVDMSAPEYAKTVAFYSTDQIGRAEFINAKSDSMPLANSERSKFNVDVFDAAIGYGFSLVEVGQAAMEGINLNADAAGAAGNAAERLIDDVAFVGHDQIGLKGLYNHGDVTTVAAGGVWSTRTAAQVLSDFNKLIAGTWVSSKGIIMCDTVRMPLQTAVDLANIILTGTQTNLYRYLMDNNIYTLQTGRPLDMRGEQRLTTKAVAYRKSPRDIKLHIPMTLRFLPPQLKGINYEVPGMMRLAGIDIMNNKAIRYMSGVAA